MTGLLHEDNVNPAYFPFFQSTKRYINLRGGSGSSKSWTVGQKVLARLLNPYGHKERILVLRKVGRTVRNSVFAMLQDQIKLYNLDVTPRLSNLSFIAPNGNEIITAGLDDAEKIKSIAGITAIWLEEATEFTLQDFEQLDLRLRGHCDSYFQIILSFNPIHEKHWIKKRFWDAPVFNQQGVNEGGQYDSETMLNIVTTYKDNKFIDADYKRKLEKLITSNQNLYRIYALGEWGLEENENQWLYAFKHDKHVKPQLPFLPSYPIYLSFDFNKDPMTAVAVQMSPHKGTPTSFVHFIAEFIGKWTVAEICMRIKTMYPYSILYVTGDSSGNKEGQVGYSSKHDSAYSLIKKHLSLSKKQLHTNTANLTHENSRLLINTLLEMYPNIYLSAEGCPNLVNDCIIATVDDESGKPHQLKKDREIYKMDLFDAKRYFWQRYFTEFARSNYFELQLESKLNS